jgi:hypothetical protein
MLLINFQMLCFFLKLTRHSVWFIDSDFDDGRKLARELEFCKSEALIVAPTIFIDWNFNNYYIEILALFQIVCIRFGSKSWLKWQGFFSFWGHDLDFQDTLTSKHSSLNLTRWSLSVKLTDGQCSWSDGLIRGSVFREVWQNTRGGFTIMLSG